VVLGVDAEVAQALLRPPGLESMVLRGRPSADEPEGEEWPSRDFFGEPGTGRHSHGFHFDDVVRSGERLTVTGFVESPAPRGLRVVGWVWSRRIDLPVRASAGFARRLPRLATADENVMEDLDRAGRHLARARAEGFLAPGLQFHVAGGGRYQVARGTTCCGGLGGGFSGGGVGRGPPPLDPLEPLVAAPLGRCGLAADPAGDVSLDVEVQAQEILAVTSAGGDEATRRCAEEALWNLELPEGFNKASWRRAAYQLSLARRSARGGASAGGARAATGR
jgi:hypothetical protein